MITCFEYVKIDNKDILFTGSKDGYVKAWLLDTKNDLTCVLQEHIQAPVNCMTLIAPTILAVGLDNGYIY